MIGLFCRFLRQKKDGDPNFVNFIEQRRGAELHTLESLLQLPVSRIKEYTKLLVQLLDVTPEDHIDYSDLREASHRLNLVSIYLCTCACTVMQ